MIKELCAVLISKVHMFFKSLIVKIFRKKYAEKITQRQSSIGNRVINIQAGGDIQRQSINLGSE
jgi:hypothetical protein